jgi:predicted permease
MPIQLHIEPDWRVAVYAAILAIATAAFCGPLPAWQSVRDSVNSGLQRERKLRGRRLLVVVQIAISFVVLATGALFLQNLFRSSALGPGFDVRQTVRAEVHLPPATYKNQDRINPFVEQALRELRSIPGIDAAAAARIIPFTDSASFSVHITFADGEKQNARFHWNAVTPEFFRAMSIPILQGRPFSSQDGQGIKVAIVNAEFVRRYLGQRNPVGTTFVWDGGSTTIVGVVRGTKNVTIGEDEQPQLYQPLAQIANTRPRLQFVLRSTLPPAIQLDPVRQALRRVESSAGLEVATMFSSIGLAFLPSQIGAVLMGSIGALGLLLAAIGLYGVLAFSVTRRTREIGVRMAIGATRREISRMVLLETARLLVAGIVVGLVIAVFVTRPLSIFLVPGLQTTDLTSLALVVAALCCTGLAAALGPVRRAITIDPMTCLRYE